MDESALQQDLARIRKRQSVIIALLVVPYFVAGGVVLGRAVALTLYTLVGLCLAVVLAFRRRADRQ